MGHGMNNILYSDFGGTAESQMRKAVLDFIKEAKIKLRKGDSVDLSPKTPCNSHRCIFADTDVDLNAEF